MLVPNITLTLLKISPLSGVSKRTGKEYSFSKATVVDSEANVFEFTLSKDALEKARSLKLLDKKNFEALVDVNFLPKGFDAAGQITNFLTVA